MNSPHNFVPTELPLPLIIDVEKLVALGATTAIDIGCYNGKHSYELSDLGLDVTALDARHRDIKPPVTFVQGDAQLIDQFGKYDLALCFCLIYHLENPVAFLAKMPHVAPELFLATAVVAVEQHQIDGCGGMVLQKEYGDVFSPYDATPFMFTEDGLDRAMELAGYELVTEYSRDGENPAWIIRRYKI